MIAATAWSASAQQSSELPLSPGVTVRDERISVCLVFEDFKGVCLPTGYAALLGNGIRVVLTNRSSDPRYVALVRPGASTFEADRFPDGAAIHRLGPGEKVTVAMADFPPGIFAEMRVLSSPDPFDPTAMTTSTIPETLIASTFVMGESDEPQPAVGGGVAAAFGEADWMVALYDPRPYSKAEIDADSALPLEKRRFLAEKTPEERAHSCGGAMIGDNIVITAAHCVATGAFEGAGKTKVFTERRVRLGSLRLGKGGETRAIVGMAVHAGYDGKSSGQPNDIALLLLKRDDTIHLRPRALRIASRPLDLDSVLMVLGWGYSKETRGGVINLAQAGTAQRNAVALQKAPMQPISKTDCVRAFGNKIKPGMVCLGTPRARLAAGGPPTFSCRGDSGGPLIRNFGSEAGEELVGLVSWSVGCGNGKPSVYTDVPHFARWIAAARGQLRGGAAITVPEPARTPGATRRN